MPASWRGGRGIFLPKPGNNCYQEAKSFRMITLTSFHLKWLERMILYHLNEDQRLQDRLARTQYGFRAGVSTETALHEFVLRVERSLAKKKLAVGIFLDIMGAFDNITFRSLGAALRELQVPRVLIHWIEFMVRYRTVQVGLHDKTVTREVTKGSPQGGILSPFLWKCVMNSVLLEFQKEKIYAQAYADDLVVLVAGANALWVRGRAQRAINVALEWARNTELQFSSSKTEVVLFTQKRVPQFGTLWMNGAQLELSYEAKLLGVTLDSKLTWKSHIMRISSKATAALMQCRQIVGKTWGIKPRMMKWIYTAMVRPIITYACVSWIGGCEKLYLRKKLQKVQRLACIMVSSAFSSTPSGALENLLNIPPIEEFLRAEALRGSY